MGELQMSEWLPGQVCVVEVLETVVQLLKGWRGDGEGFGGELALLG
jgi:hypothetical protein